MNEERRGKENSLMYRFRVPSDREGNKVDDFWMVGKVKAS
jgi:hypothetical protein